MNEQQTNPESRLDLSDAGDDLEQPATPAPGREPAGAGHPVPSPEDLEEIEIELPREAAEYVEQLKAQLDEAIAARQRALADFRNYQRRSIENEQQALSTGARNVIHSLLPVLDHFDLALNQDRDTSTVESVLNGVKIVRDEINKVLQLQGVEIISPQVGDEFDPNRHEAMMRQSAEGVEPNSIVMVMQPGYMMGDLVLRPAKVAVAPGEDDE